MDYYELEDARLRLRMTRKEFSKALGVQVNTLDKWRYGVRKVHPSAARLVKLLMASDNQSDLIRWLAEQE